ncbi:MAG: hypothetical protein K2H20_03785, partial [Bacilli bacterium]|nr:hypothetical protein [Bacilli bacterium]
SGIILDVVVGLLLKNNIIAYCNDVLEKDIFISCNLRGIEYVFLMILIFLPLFIIPVFEVLIFIHKKITKREKMDFIDWMVIFLVFLIIFFIVGLFIYTASF